MSQFKCYLCGGNNERTVAASRQMRFGCYGYDKKVVECAGCGLVQLYPQWTPGELDELYSKYWQKQDFPGQKKKVKISDYIDRFIKKGDSILEIGCGWGDNLKRLRSKGYDVTGIDKDPAVCDGNIVLQYDIKDYKLGKKFDFIYGIHLFEHMSDPRSFIGAVADKLKDNGSFLLEVPSLDDPLLKLYKIKRFNEFYWYPYHLFFYDKVSIKILFNYHPELEIKIYPIQQYGLINHLRWLIFRRPGNWNAHIPVLDDIYKSILVRILGHCDTMVVHGKLKKRTGKE